MNKDYLAHGEKNLIILYNNKNSPYSFSDFLQYLNKSCLKQETSWLEGKPEELWFCQRHFTTTLSASQSNKPRKLGGQCTDKGSQSCHFLVLFLPVPCVEWRMAYCPYYTLLIKTVGCDCIFVSSTSYNDN